MIKVMIYIKYKKINSLWRKVGAKVWPYNNTKVLYIFLKTLISIYII
jgi:hypothetical protein